MKHGFVLAGSDLWSRYLEADKRCERAGRRKRDRCEGACLNRPVTAAISDLDPLCSGRYFCCMSDQQTPLLHYSNLGRPSIDPELTLRMLILGYVFAIRSERQLVREVQVNLA
jgi:Transposase domain (DUF772)